MILSGRWSASRRSCSAAFMRLANTHWPLHSNSGLSLFSHNSAAMYVRLAPNHISTPALSINCQANRKTSDMEMYERIIMWGQKYFFSSHPNKHLAKKMAKAQSDAPGRHSACCCRLERLPL